MPAIWRALAAVVRHRRGAVGQTVPLGVVRMTACFHAAFLILTALTLLLAGSAVVIIPCAEAAAGEPQSVRPT